MAGVISKSQRSRYLLAATGLNTFAGVSLVALVLAQMFGLSFASYVVAVASLIAAILIFLTQRHQSSKITEIQHALLADIVADTKRIIGKINVGEMETNTPMTVEEQAAQDDELDEVDDFDDNSGEPVSVGNQPGRFFNSSEVPLSVLSNLVQGWRNLDEYRNNDNTWTTGNVVGAWRPIPNGSTGRGNTPWYVTFIDSKDERRVWRVWRGGRSKTRPTVREVTAEVEGHPA